MAATIDDTASRPLYFGANTALHARDVDAKKASSWTTPAAWTRAHLGVAAREHIPCSAPASVRREQSKLDTVHMPRFKNETEDAAPRTPRLPTRSRWSGANAPAASSQRDPRAATHPAIA